MLFISTLTACYLASDSGFFEQAA